MAYIHCRNTISDFEGISANQEIGKGDPHPSGSVFAVHAASAQRNGDRDRQYRDRSHELVKELAPYLLSLERIGPGDSVREFDHSDDGDSQILVPGSFRDFRDCAMSVFPLPFLGNDYAGIENEGHAFSPSQARLTVRGAPQ